jgi:hypothetical protein
MPEKGPLDAHLRKDDQWTAAAALDQLLTHAMQQRTSLFDNLARAGAQAGASNRRLH